MVVLLAAPGLSRGESPAGTPVAGFVPIETVVAADCWGQFGDDVLASVRGCKKADDNRLALRVVDDADGPVRVGLDGTDCAAARCAGLATALAVAPQRRLLLRTPVMRLDATLAALDAAAARTRVQIEPIVPAPPVPGTAQRLAPGVRYWHQAYSGAVASIVAIELDTPGLDWVGTAGDRSGGGEFVAATTSEFVRRNGLLLAINASYFLPFDGGRLLDRAFVPVAGQGVNAEGQVINAGRLESAAGTEDRRVDAAFCVDARAGARIVRGTCGSGTRLGIGAGPLLLMNGQPQRRERSREEYYDTPQPRSAIGLDRSGRTLWLVVVDGRQPGYSDGMTLDALTALFRQLGAASALNLDGGGSSTLAARVHGRVQLLNQPIHTGIPGRERPVATQLGLRVGAGSPP